MKKVINDQLHWRSKERKECSYRRTLIRKKCTMQSNLCDYSKETKVSNNVEKNLKDRSESDQTKVGEYFSNLECNLFIYLFLLLFKVQLPLT